MNLWEELKNDALGTAILMDWLGKGGQPVAQAKADSRSEICRSGNGGKPCPNNTQPNWWNRFVSAIAITIRYQLELKHRMAIRVEGEDELHMCAGCGCCLKLKVWTPIEHIQEHTTDDQMRKFTSFCWIKKELKP